MATFTKRRKSTPRRHGMTLALYEGGLATVFTELTGGARQIGFALLLGGRDFQIGLLSALPFLANLSQLIASFLLERTQQRKVLSAITAALSRLVWVVIVFLPLGVFGVLSDLRIWVLVGIVALSALFAAMNNMVWLSWLGDLVPERLRGRYFGRRNIVMAAVGMGVTLVAGVFIDAWESWFSSQDARGFLVVFAVGILCGLAAIVLQWRMPDIPVASRQSPQFFSRLAIPLRDTNFRRFIVFQMCWEWSVKLASPFFAVYMLKSLEMSYTAITVLTSLTALCNMLGMRVWGQLTDRLSAKPVSLLGGILAAMLPGLWLMTAVAPIWVVLPVLHMLGGFGWSACNLNLNTLLLALSPRQERAVYLGVYAALTGLTTAGAPVVGGLLGKAFQNGLLPFSHGLNPYLLLFALSCLLRLLSLGLFLRVHEPQEVPLERLLLVLGNLRTLSTMIGFDPLFHHTYMQGKRLDRFIVSTGSAMRQRLERLDHQTDTYADTSATEVEELLERGEHVLDEFRERRAELEHHLDNYVTRSEARIASWLNFLISWIKKG